MDEAACRAFKFPAPGFRQSTFLAASRSTRELATLSDNLSLVMNMLINGIGVT